MCAQIRKVATSKGEEFPVNTGCSFLCVDFFNTAFFVQLYPTFQALFYVRIFSDFICAGAL